MTYHTCPVCGEEDGIEMRYVAGPDSSTNAGPEFDLAGIHCDCLPEQITADQWEHLDREAAEKDLWR